MKKLVKIMSSTLAMILMVSSLTGCNFNKEDEKAESSEAATYVSLRINPEIELIADEDDEVVAVNAINEDGEVVLAVSDFIGDTIEEATEEFVDAAVELGYIDVESEESTVYVHVDGESEEIIEDIEEKINTRVHKYFDDKGIFGKVEKELMDEYIDKSKELNIGVGHVRMIERILELYPEMTEEELLEMDIKELLELLKEDVKNNGLKVTQRDEYRQAVEALKEEYLEMFELLDELRLLEKQLKDLELDEDIKALIEARIVEIRNECDTMKAAFEEALESLKETYKSQVDIAVNEFKNRAEQRKKENASKLEKHIQDFNMNKEDIKNQIQDWRNRLGK